MPPFTRWRHIKAQQIKATSTTTTYAKPFTTSIYTRQTNWCAMPPQESLVGHSLEVRVGVHHVSLASHLSQLDTAMSQVVQLLHTLDSDHDGVLSLGEFVSGLQVP